MNEPPPGLSGPERIHGLDALRGVLMLLGIVLHTALAYFPPEWEAWAFQDPRANSEQMGIVVELALGS